jgi:hypothetical protein
MNHDLPKGADERSIASMFCARLGKDLNVPQQDFVPAPAFTFDSP